jgi:hypothetical protein
MLCIAPAAIAKDRGVVTAAGTCDKASSAKLKLHADDGRIEVEFEVDQNRVGVKWAVVIRHRGSIALRTTKITRAPSGSFEARAFVGNGAGADAITATATRSGETCTARASL